MSEAASLLSSCFHCGDAVPPAMAGEVLEIEGREVAFCCPACRMVAMTIRDSGLTSYYRFRDERGDKPTTPARYDAFDQPAFQRRWVRRRSDGLVETELLLEGMHCAACIWLIEHHLRQLPGVREVQVNLSEQRCQVSWEPDVSRLSNICSAVAAIGYQPQPFSADRLEQSQRAEQRRLLRQLGVAGLGSMQVGMAAIGLYAADLQGGIHDSMRELLRWASLWLSIPIVVYSGMPFLRGAWRGVKARRPGMDLPVAVAIVLGFLASAWATWQGTGEIYYDSVTMFIFLLLTGRYLESRARAWSSRGGTDLNALLPLAATRFDADGKLETIPLETLRKGDRVVVAAGQTLPADGILLERDASVNEAALTGEFMPVHKQPGDLLTAGAVNGDQPLVMTVEATGADLRLQMVQRLARQAEQHKPLLAQLADRMASAFVIAVLVLSGLTWLGWHFIDPGRAFWVALSVLVVSCPCALGLATPMALTTATQALRRQGLLVTRGAVWEALPTITDVVFDKTGTLTEGRIELAETRPVSGRSADVCIAIAAALEVGSSHPIAAAFGAAAGNMAEQRRDVAGLGVEGVIAGRRYRLGVAAFAVNGEVAPPGSGHWIALAEEGELICWFRLDDALRRDTAATVAALQELGLRLHLLSGDRSDSVARLATELGFDHYVDSATPADKLAYLTRLQGDGKRVLM
ncbi:MAG: heavy metal translocating P-type ATPase, partial [Spongiibacteraceae bacterium]|nr:heavy metal translocating P-type ATPase [Spongiibacteraceae bacterium]